MDINELNLQTVNTALGFDDTELHKHVQCDKFATTEDGTTLYFISSYEPKYGDVESYVICDNRGNVSYYDFSNEVVVFRNELRGDWAPYSRIPSVLRDQLRELFDDYCFECKLDPNLEHNIVNGIKPYLALLKKCMEYK